MGLMSNGKMWAKDEFWGLGYEWDPQWLLSPGQVELQTRLIDLCSSTLRDNAVESDRKLLFPRKNFEALAKLGLLGLIVPEEWGGLGQDHTAAAMVVETIARYGCDAFGRRGCLHASKPWECRCRASDEAT
jgi:alkylation response protein AidB-like acyl-CoA dehydrogenase